MSLDSKYFENNLIEDYDLNDPTSVANTIQQYEQDRAIIGAVADEERDKLHQAELVRQQKLQALQEAQTNKIQNLSTKIPEGYVQGTITASPDADTFRLNDDPNLRIRETSDMYRYDAVETHEQPSWLESTFGGYKGKSDYSLDQQRSQTAKLLGKEPWQVTEGDMVDVGVWQHKMKLFDAMHPDAPVDDPNRPKFEEGANPEDQYNLNIPVYYNPNAKRDESGRLLTDLYSPSGVNLTNLHTEDARMNAFAPDNQVTTIDDKEYYTDANGELQVRTKTDKSLWNAAKSLPVTFYDELISKPARALEEWVMGEASETEEERQARVNNIFGIGYNPQYAQQQALQRQEYNEVLDDPNATTQQKISAAIDITADAMTDLSVWGSSVGALAAWMMPGGILTKGTKGAAKLAQIEKLRQAGKLTAVQAAKKKAAVSLATKEGIKTTLKGQVGMVNAAVGNTNQQYHEWVKNNNGEDYPGGKAAFMMERLPVQLINQNLDKITDISIMKSPAALKGIKDAIVGASNKQMGTFVTGVGKTLLSTAFVQMPKEAAQEYTQQMMEAFNTRYGSAKFEDIETFKDFVTNKENWSEARLAAFEGAGGAVQFQAMGTAWQGVKKAPSLLNKKQTETTPEVGEGVTGPVEPAGTTYENNINAELEEKSAEDISALYENEKQALNAFLTETNKLTNLSFEKNRTPDNIGAKIKTHLDILGKLDTLLSIDTSKKIEVTKEDSQRFKSTRDANITEVIKVLGYAKDMFTKDGYTDEEVHNSIKTLLDQASLSNTTRELLLEEFLGNEQILGSESDLKNDLDSLVESMEGIDIDVPTDFGEETPAGLDLDSLVEDMKDTEIDAPTDFGEISVPDDFGPSVEDAGQVEQIVDQKFTNAKAKAKAKAKTGTHEKLETETSETETHTVGTSERTINRLADMFGLDNVKVQRALQRVLPAVSIKKMKTVSTEADKAQRELYFGKDSKKLGIQPLYIKYRKALQQGDKKTAVEAIVQLQKLGYSQEAKLRKWEYEFNKLSDEEKAKQQKKADTIEAIKESVDHIDQILTAEGFGRDSVEVSEQSYVQQLTAAEEELPKRQEVLNKAKTRLEQVKVLAKKQLKEGKIDEDQYVKNISTEAAKVKEAQKAVDNTTEQIARLDSNIEAGKGKDIKLIRVPNKKKTEAKVEKGLGADIDQKVTPKHKPIGDINEVPEMIKEYKEIPKKLEETKQAQAEEEKTLQNRKKLSGVVYAGRYNNLTKQDQKSYNKITSEIKALTEKVETLTASKKAAKNELKRADRLKTKLEEAHGDVDAAYDLLDQTLDGKLDRQEAAIKYNEKKYTLSGALKVAKHLLNKANKTIKLGALALRSMLVTRKHDEIMESINNIDTEITNTNTRIAQLMADRAELAPGVHESHVRLNNLKTHLRKLKKSNYAARQKIYDRKDQILRTLKSGNNLRNDVPNSVGTTEHAYVGAESLEGSKLFTIKGTLLNSLNLLGLKGLVETQAEKDQLDKIAKGEAVLKEAIKLKMYDKKKGAMIERFAESPASALVFDKNGNILPTFARGIVFGAENFIGNSGGKLLVNSGDDIARMRNKTSEYQVTEEEKGLLREGKFKKLIARQLGHQIALEIGLKFNDDVSRELVGKIEQDLGQMGLLYLQEQKYIKPLDTTKIPAAKWQEATGEKVKQDVGLVVANRAHLEEFTAIREAMKGIDDVLQIDDGSRNYIIQKPNSVEKKKVYTVHNSYFDVPEKSQEILRELEDRKFVLLEDSMKLFTQIMETPELKTAYLKAVGWKDLKKMEGKYLLDSIKAQEAKNMEVERDIETLMDLNNRINSGLINNELYFNWLFAKNGRYLLDSTLVNPQTGKVLHRFMVVNEESANQTWNFKNSDKTKIQKADGSFYTEDELYFYGGIAQAFEVSIDKKATKEILEAGEKFSKMSQEELLKLAATMEHPGHALQAVAAIAKMDTEKEFTAAMTAEFDAVTSGFIIKLLQMPIIGEEKVVEWLEKGGVLTRKNLSKLKEGEGINDLISNPEFNDSYETLVLKAANEDTLAKFEKDNPEMWPALAEGTTKDKEPTIGTLLNKDGTVSKFARDLFKYPFMISNYAGSINAIKKRIGQEVTMKVLQGILDGDYDTKKGLLKKQLVDGDQKAWEQLKEDLKTKTLDQVKVKGKPILKTISKVFETTYGGVLETTMSTEFGEFEQANQTIIRTTRLLMQGFLQELEKAVEDFQNKHGKGMSEKEYREVVRSLAKHFPLIAAPNSKGELDNIAVFTEGVVNASKELLKPVQTYGKNSKDEFQQHTVQGLTKEIQEAFAAGAVLPVHWLDGTIIGEVLGSNPILGIHDAILLGLGGKRTKEIVNDMNKATYETNRDYSFVEALAAAAERILSTSDLENLKGIEIYEDGEAVTIPPREILSDLQELQDKVAEARAEFYSEAITVGNIAGFAGTPFTGTSTKSQEKGTDLSILIEKTPETERATAKKDTPTFDKLPSPEKDKVTLTYAGIGSRQTPAEILKEMTTIAKDLDSLGYTLNTGITFGNKEEGADKAFSDGTKNKNLFSPEKHGARTTEQAVAKEIHPNPKALKPGGLKLMARNTNQVFGDKLDTPVDFVLFYAKEGKGIRPEGGTGQAVEMARRKGIPTINMADADWRTQLAKVTSMEGSKRKTEPIESKEEEKVVFNSTDTEKSTKDDVPWFTDVTKPQAAYQVGVEKGDYKITSMQQFVDFLKKFTTPKNAEGKNLKDGDKVEVFSQVNVEDGKHITYNFNPQNYASLKGPEKLAEDGTEVKVNVIGHYKDTDMEYRVVEVEYNGKKYTHQPSGVPFHITDYVNKENGIKPFMAGQHAMNNPQLIQKATGTLTGTTSTFVGTYSSKFDNTRPNVKFNIDKSIEWYSKILQDMDKAGFKFRPINLHVVNKLLDENGFDSDQLGRAMTNAYNEASEVFMPTEVMGVMGPAKTIVHEYVHTITAEALEADMPARKRIRDIMDKAEPILRQHKQWDDVAYAFTSEEEFVAEVIANPILQSMLDKIEGTQTVVEKIVKLFRQIMSRFQGDKATLLTDTLTEIKELQKTNQKVISKSTDWEYQVNSTYDKPFRKEVFDSIAKRLKETYPEISVESLAKIVNEDGIEVVGRALGKLVQYNPTKVAMDTLPHEYAHIYINLLDKTTLMKETLNEIITDRKVNMKQAKEILADEMGQQYVDYMTNANARLLNKKKFNLLDKAWNFIKNKLGIGPSLEEKISILSDRFFKGDNKDAIRFSLKEGYEKVDTEATFQDQPFAALVLSELMKEAKGEAQFTGSAALALQGDIYRKGKNGITDLHDLDIAVTTKMLGKLPKILYDKFNSFLIYDFGAKGKISREIRTFIVVPKELQVLSKDIIRTKHRVTDYIIRDKQGKEVGTYHAEVDPKTNNIISETTTGEKAVIVDLLEDNEKPEGVKYYSKSLDQEIVLSQAGAIFDAKNEMGRTPRDKDIMDFNTFYGTGDTKEKPGIIQDREMNQKAEEAIPDATCK